MNLSCQGHKVRWADRAGTGGGSLRVLVAQADAGPGGASCGRGHGATLLTTGSNSLPLLRGIPAKQ